jgi:hypothetical protein
MEKSLQTIQAAGSGETLGIRLLREMAERFLLPMVVARSEF